MNKLLLTFFVLSLSSILYSQNGYYFEPGFVEYPDTSILTSATELAIPFLKEDVKAIGMGKTQIANGKYLNGMLYNPAILKRGRTSFEVIGIQASLPPKTYDAANYIQSHRREFEEAYSLQEVWLGLQEFNNAQTWQQQIAAIKRMQEGLKVPYELSRDIIGSSDNPNIHGIRVIPSISGQINNFGFSIYGIGQSAFMVQLSPITEAALAVNLPENTDNLDINSPEVQNAIIQLYNVLQVAFNNNNDVNTEILPITYSISYVDIVGAAGYGMKLNPYFSIGANLKVIHRRFSASRVVTKHYEDILNVLKRDLTQYTTGFTMDVGGMLSFPTGTEIGLSIQNIIPVQKITSTMHANFYVSYYDYKRDINGNILLTNQGDTIIQTVGRNVDVGLPFDLKVPVLVNLGAIHPITPDWDVALDIFDIAKQDVRFQKYFERLRIGTEYRLNFQKNLGFAFRLGMAELRPTFGFGFNLFNIMQLDAAFAYDNFVGENSVYAQVKFGW
ncbi:MAG: hypothetical protein ACM3O3_06140 [Syntrophothermus sp.]